MTKYRKICPNCDGSGEGMHEGTRCYTCKCSGLEKDGSAQDYLDALAEENFEAREQDRQDFERDHEN